MPGKPTPASPGPSDLTAEHFVARMEALRSADELRKIQRYFKSGDGEYGAGDEFMGVRMGQVFALAKEFPSVYLTPRGIRV